MIDDDGRIIFFIRFIFHCIGIDEEDYFSKSVFQKVMIRQKCFFKREDVRGLFRKKMRPAIFNIEFKNKGHHALINKNSS